MISLVLLLLASAFFSAHYQLYPLVCAPLTSTGSFFEPGLFLFFFQTRFSSEGYLCTLSIKKAPKPTRTKVFVILLLKCRCSMSEHKLFSSPIKILAKLDLLTMCSKQKLLFYMWNSECAFYKSVFSCVLLLQLVLEPLTPPSPLTTLLTWILRSPPIEKLFYCASAYKTFQDIICSVYTMHLYFSGRQQSFV